MPLFKQISDSPKVFQHCFITCQQLSLPGYQSINYKAVGGFMVHTSTHYSQGDKYTYKWEQHWNSQGPWKTPLNLSKLWSSGSKPERWIKQTVNNKAKSTARSFVTTPRIMPKAHLRWTKCAGYTPDAKYHQTKAEQLKADSRNKRKKLIQWVLSRYKKKKSSSPTN